MARSSYRPPKIPEMTIRRLSVYTRCLLQLEEDGIKTISSQELAERFNLNSAQVRKDLAYFGEFGVRGIGYYVSGLKAELQRILGLDLGATTGGEMIWAVYAPTTRRFGALAGHYAGATAEATVGAGLGANVLVGGSRRTIALQPIAVQGQAGLNVAVGVAGLDLRPAR